MGQVLTLQISVNLGVMAMIEYSSLGIKASPSDDLVSHLGHSLGRLLLCRNAVSVFYSPDN